MKRIFSMLLVCLMLLGAAYAEPASLTVTGNGVVSVTADCAEVVLGVRETSADVLEAQGTVNGKINAIVAALLEAGIEKKDIGTESLYIYANYDYSAAGQESLVGYTATNTISIRTSQMDKVGEYIDIAFGAGANTLDTVNFTVQSNEAAQKEALELAVQNALEQADVIAAAAGMQVTAVNSIEEEESYYSGGAGAKYSNARGAEAAVADQSSMVQSTTLQVSATVRVEFEMSKGEP